MDREAIYQAIAEDVRKLSDEKLAELHNALSEETGSGFTIRSLGDGTFEIARMPEDN